MGEEEAGSLTEWKLLIGIDNLSKRYNLKWAEKEVHLINSFTQSPKNQGNSSMHYPVEELRKFPHTTAGLRSQGKTERASEKATKILCAWKNRMFTVLPQTNVQNNAWGIETHHCGEFPSWERTPKTRGVGMNSGEDRRVLGWAALHLSPST